MNSNGNIGALIFPIGFFILGILFIVFRKIVGKFLYKINEFYNYHTKHASHMKTLFKYHDKVFGGSDVIEDYYKAPIKMGLVLIFASIAVTLLFIVWGVI